MTAKRLYHSVADKITSLINDGTYPPGSRLPGERELAEQFDVSRVTIREAEIALQALGQVTIKTGSGVYIQDLSGKDAQTLPNVSAFELTEARSLFESEAAALAARNISDNALQRLADLIDTMSVEDPDNDEASNQADREFHLTIAAASSNAVVQYVIETLWKIRNELPAIRDIHTALCSQEAPYDRGAEHTAILIALRNRDPLAARVAMQNHFTRLLTSMIDVTEEQALQELRRKARESRQRYLNDSAHGRTT